MFSNDRVVGRAREWPIQDPIQSETVSGRFASSSSSSSGCLAALALGQETQTMAQRVAEIRKQHKDTLEKAAKEGEKQEPEQISAGSSKSPDELKANSERRLWARVKWLRMGRGCAVESRPEAVIKDKKMREQVSDTKKDPEKIIDMLIKLAHSGNKRAQYEFGVYFLNRSRKPDADRAGGIIKAKEWLKKAGLEQSFVEDLIKKNSV